MQTVLPALDTLLLHVNGLDTSPLAMADHKNNRLTIELADPRDAHEAEVIGRNICVAFDMMAGLSGWMVNQAQIEAAIGNGTITRAKTVGEVMATYKTENTTENFYAYLAKHSSLKCQAVCRGKITKVETKTAGGFDYGTATVAGEDGSTYMVLFQNENLVIYKDGIVVMTAPDIISFYEINDGMPLTNADTKEGQYVDIGIIEVEERRGRHQRCVGSLLQERGVHRQNRSLSRQVSAFLQNPTTASFLTSTKSRGRGTVPVPGFLSK